jgi:GNAT superfamily N-acetyltransferase
MKYSRIPADEQTQPRLYYSSVIHADSSLASTITAFVNEGYRYVSPKSAPRWNPTFSDRLPTPESLHEVLGNDGVFAVIYNPHDKSIPIACAALKPWKGDYGGYVEPRAGGWEVLTVTTHVGWMRRGLARRCVDALIDDLVERTRKTDKGNSDAKVQIWIHAVEDLNGAYWKKQGWAEIRSYPRPAGEFGSKEGYKLLVLLQEFDTR